MFISILSRVGVIFAVLFVGALARRTNVLNKEATEGLCRVVIEVMLPFLYFYTLATNLSKELFLDIWYLPLFAFGLTAISLLVSWLFSRPALSDKEGRRTFVFLGTFGNYGFLAIPIIYALFAQEGLVMISVFNLGIALLYWTLGLSILTGAHTQGIKVFKNLFNNSIYGLLLGLVAGIGSIAVPEFILEISKLIGAAAIPLALIVVGSLLAHKDIGKKVDVKCISLLVLCRLICIPLLVFILIRLFGIDSKVLVALLVLQAAMPSASTTPILTQRFGGKTELAASGVFFTTLLSILTIPILLSIALR